MPIPRPEWDDLRQQNRIRGSLLDSVGTTTTGAWQDLRGLYPLSVTIEDAGDPTDPDYVALVGTFEVRVSDAPLRPLDAQDGMILGEPVVWPGDNPPQPVRVEASFAWVKVKVTDLPSGVASAYIYGGPH